MPSPLPPVRPPREPVREVPVCLDDEGNEHARSVLSPTHFKVRAGCMLLPRLVVPIVFLPGVMGTRLRNKHYPDEAAWHPPENTWGKLCALFSYLGKNAAKRQRLLDPGNTEVDPDGLCRPDPDTAPLLAIAPGANADEQAVSRGWGALHADSYAKILCALERRLAYCFVEHGGTLAPEWDEAIFRAQQRLEAGRGAPAGDAQPRPAAPFGAEHPFEALSEAELRLAAQAGYPVHAVGYNWLRSNREAGEHLAAEIRRITDYYAQRRRICEKVILVTHSMGGLVARACAEASGLSDQILGIVHGVQPAIGAPAAYKRMRAGFEGPEQVVLGRNAAECTAVLAHAPGPLELLPHAQYRARGEDGRDATGCGRATGMAPARSSRSPWARAIPSRRSTSGARRRAGGAW